MLEMKNGFECRDNDCMQCSKQIGKNEYLFIQAIWLDSVDQYCVVANIENVSEMEREDIECAISGYYESIQEMENAYGMSLEELGWLVAECSFESNPFCNFEYESDVVSWNRAREIVQKFIDSNGEVFLRK